MQFDATYSVLKFSSEAEKVRQSVLIIKLSVFLFVCYQ